LGDAFKDFVIFRVVDKQFFYCNFDFRYKTNEKIIRALSLYFKNKGSLISIVLMIFNFKINFSIIHVNRKK